MSEKTKSPSKRIRKTKKDLEAEIRVQADVQKHLKRTNTGLKDTIQTLNEKLKTYKKEADDVAQAANTWKSAFYEAKSRAQEAERRILELREIVQSVLIKEPTPETEEQKETLKRKIVVKIAKTLVHLEGMITPAFTRYLPVPDMLRAVQKERRVFLDQKEVDRTQTAAPFFPGIG